MAKIPKIPSSLISPTAMFMHILALPAFYLGFILIYESSWIFRLLHTGGELSVVYNTLILTSILIGVMLFSRIPLTVMRLKLSWWQYTLWILGELFIFSGFAALYIALLYGNYGYFPALGACIRLSFATLSYPYIIFSLLMALIRPDEQATSEDDLVRFADSTGRLKLVIAQDVILYIEAQENYVSIHYLEGEQRKDYSLRQSMRGIEELMEKHGIIRCQRSYFVNPRHVKVLRRDKEGMIQAELDVTNIKPVPVSPKYYEQLSLML